MTSPITSRAGSVEPVFPQQLPAIPIEPPDPLAEVYGRMTWDLPASISYVAYREVIAAVDIWNPTGIDRMYAVGYYFINPQGVIVAHDYLQFLGGITFTAFLLYANSPVNMTTVVTFKAPSVGYKFGLQLLELEMSGTIAVVKYETSRLEVALGIEQNGGGGGGGIPLTDMLGAVLIMVPMALIVKEIQGGKNNHGRI